MSEKEWHKAKVRKKLLYSEYDKKYKEKWNLIFFDWITWNSRNWEISICWNTNTSDFFWFAQSENIQNVVKNDEKHKDIWTSRFLLATTKEKSGVVD